MATVKIRLEGVADFERAMAAVGRVANEELKPLLLEGAQVVEATIRPEAAEQKRYSTTGDMARSIDAKLARDARDIAAYVFVDFEKIKKTDRTGKKVRYPYIVNYGADPHTVAGRQHPGFEPTRFFTRGARKGLPVAQKLIESGMIRKIEAINRGAA